AGEPGQRTFGIPGQSRNPAVDLGDRTVRVGRVVERDHGDLELLVLPEGDVDRQARDIQRKDGGVVPEPGCRALLDGSAGRLQAGEVGVADVEVLRRDLVARCGGRSVLESDRVDVRDLARGRARRELPAV